MTRSLRRLESTAWKTLRFKRGLPALSKNLKETVSSHYNIIILDDLMAEGTVSNVAS